MKRNGQKVASLFFIVDKQRWRSITNDFQERNRDGGMNRAETRGGGNKCIVEFTDDKQNFMPV